MEPLNPYPTRFMLNVDQLLPCHSIDCVIIGYDKGELSVLVLKWKDLPLWSLPGGFIKIDEHLNEAALRILKDRTGLDMPFLTQFHTFGQAGGKRMSVESDIRELIKSHYPSMGTWFENRFITTGYLAMVQPSECRLTPDELSESCVWIPIKDLPDLIYDHNTIVKQAIAHVKRQLNYLPVGKSLLPETFTMKSFKLLYESILGRELDRANFQKKMLKLGMLTRRGKENKGGAHKAPYLYSFDHDKYQELLEKGIGFIP
jgi:ADP-ribose pyrophosphatase YjhB (NUDIX family)